MRVIIAGGGTGGHIIPGLAIARALQAKYSAEILFIGTARGLETKLIPQAGFELRLVTVGALKGVSLAKRAQTILDLPRAIFAAGKIISEFRADVVVGVGGYVSGPAMIAAILRRVPTLAFEMNAVPGLANRLVAKFVTASAVHFDDTKKYFRNPTVTGVPVRKEFLTAPAKHERERPTILVTGGSQGAKALNRAFREAAPELLKRVPGLRIVHQTGDRDFTETKAVYEQTGTEAEVSPFIADMPATFSRADLLMCRAGASTVAEVAASGKAAIFVPFPFATDDHQKRNAQVLTANGAALLIDESELTPERVANEVSSLITNQKRLIEMGAAAKGFSHPGAAEEIAEIVARMAQRKKN